MKKIKYNDYPMDEVLKQVGERIKDGFTCYQKFTCSGCGQRLTMDVPNQFFEEGTCDKCPAVTDIKKTGCNYLATNLPDAVLNLAGMGRK